MPRCSNVRISRSERVIKVSKRLMQFLMPRKALAFCVPKISVLNMVVTVAAAILLLAMLLHFLAVPVFVMLVPSVMLGVPLIFMLSLYFSSAIIIRKDCYECQFGFHIIAHERNHLILNSRDEFLVEEETLKQTGGRLVSILLSNPKTCKDCFFAWRRMYSQATSDYLKQEEKKR